ncbi:hypothetical protein FNV43_RR15405 [Rhamnella rubrinervis]|uniref:J domain-containing protein n=1 Tax=Rhamnella rubrinervis TaxID=2594499 RepID=A0A8K0GX55_9ROSA|nr:hypothetical protein FNV43_RR15405 [Rhamnella rubrinervis]
MDHYKALGLSRNATKDQIKEAFRRLAVELHPDKHSSSSKSVRDSATLRFKQVSEAYQVLSDHRTRADYDFRSRSGAASTTSNSKANYGYAYYNHANYGSGYGGARYRPSSSNVDGLVSRFDSFIRFLTTRTFLLNAAFASALLGGMFIVDTAKEAIWKMHNSGKSFEEAMESIEKAKARKDKI